MLISTFLNWKNSETRDKIPYEEALKSKNGQTPDSISKIMFDTNVNAIRTAMYKRHWSDEKIIEELGLCSQDTLDFYRQYFDDVEEKWY